MRKPLDTLVATAAVLSSLTLLSGCDEQDSPIDQAAMDATAVQPPAPQTSRALSPAVPAPSGPSVLAGTATPTETPTLFAKTRFVWIYPEATTDYQWIGYLWTGARVRLRSARPVYGKGCETGWYAILPRGFVCTDGKRATLNGQDAVYLTLKSLTGDLASPWPHQYAESLGATSYPGFPLVGVPAPLSLPELPPTVFEPYTELPRRSTIAYVKDLRAGERDWLLTADFQWLPKTKVTLYARSEFEGVKLSEKLTLPIAFFRTQDRPKYRRNPDGTFEPTGEKWARLSWVSLDQEHIAAGEDTFIRVAQENVFVRARDAVIPVPRATTPWGAPLGQPDTTGLAPKGRATWVESSIRGGWLIAYEGTRAVFATLVSAGRGGPPVANKPLLETASTPTGIFPVSGKFATATMANDVVVHSAVPWTQNFKGAYALHGAYWHDDFGELKSGGCINLSPKDARYLFGFTEPALPEGWHGVRWLPKLGPSTLVYVVE